MLIELIKALMEPFSYITSTPGKDFRGGMMQAFNAWLQVPQPKLQVIGRVIAMLHNASLLYAAFSFLRDPSLFPDCSRIDDIEDNSQLRRGRPGTSLAMLSTILRLTPLSSCAQDLWRSTDYQLRQLCVLSCLSRNPCSQSARRLVR